MTTTALATTILTFTAIVAVGAVLRLPGILRREDARPINALIIYVGLPAFIFSAVHGASSSPTSGASSRSRGSVFAVLAGARVARSRARSSCRVRWRAASSSRPRSATRATSATRSRRRFSATRALPEAIFYDVFGTVGALVFVGLLVAQHFGDNDEARVNPLRELVTFPAVIALAAALLLRPFPIPELVSTGLGLLASMVAPLIMISVGLSLRFSTLGSGGRAADGAERACGSSSRR